MSESLSRHFAANRTRAVGTDAADRLRSLVTRPKLEKMGVFRNRCVLAKR
jgi:hypothetical protein